MAPVLFVIGAALVIAGSALIVWQAGLIVAGLLVLLTAWDLGR